VHLLCPHCRNPIELVRLTSREEIACPSCGSSFRLDADSTAGAEAGAPQAVGRFELLGVLGRGAFGTVYKARDPQLDRTVAVKVPRAGNLAAPHDLDRFLREARAVAQLRHPAIVSVHEVGVSNALPYLVSDYVAGVSLADLLSARRPSPDESAALVADVAEALQYAHGQGVIHRDIKPSNIMLDEQSQPHVMDFGLAKRDAGEITMTVEGQVLGTPAYMSPEQARGEGHAVDGRGDLYSLGVVLYQLLTGELPFRGTQRMLLHQVLHDEPRPPRRLNDRLPRDLETICLKALAKEPGRRYQTAGEMAADLHRYLKKEPIRARPVGRLERGRRWCRRNPALAAALASVLLVFTAAAAVSTVLALRATQAWRQAGREAEHARDETILAENARNELQQANTELGRSEESLRQSNDWLVTHVARSLLGPLALEKPERPLLPYLSKPEVESLWELSSSPDEGVRLRFVDEALADRVSTRRLKARARVGLHAVVGLVASRQARVERLLTDRLEAAASQPEQQLDIALSLAALEIQDVAAARAAARVILAGVARTVSEPGTDQRRALRAQLHYLAAVASRLPPEEAANVYRSAVGRLTRALAAAEQRGGSFFWLPEGLSEVASCLGPREAAAILAEAISTTKTAYEREQLATRLSLAVSRLDPGEGASILTQILSKTDEPRMLEALLKGLRDVASRLPPQEATAVHRRAATTFARAMSTTKEPGGLQALATGLAAAASRLPPQEAAALCRPAATTLAQAMAAPTDPNRRSYSARGLVALAAHLDPKEAAALCRPVAEALAKAVATTKDTSGAPGTELSVVVSLLEPREGAAFLARAIAATDIAATEDLLSQSHLAKGLSVAASRLPPGEAAAFCGPAASTLAQAIATARRPYGPNILARDLADVASPMEPKQAATIYTQAIATTKDLLALQLLAEGLSATASRANATEAAALCRPAADIFAQAFPTAKEPLSQAQIAYALAAAAARLPRAEASALCRPAVDTLTRALRTVKEPKTTLVVAQGLSAAAARLEPKEAAAILAEAISTTKEPSVLPPLAEGLATVVTGLSPEEAAAFCRSAANALAQAMGTTKESKPLRPLAESVAALASRLRPKEATVVLTRVLSTTKVHYACPPLATGLAAAVARLSPEEASALCRPAADALVQAIARATFPDRGEALAVPLEAVASRLNPREAATVLGDAIWVMGSSKGLLTLAQALWAHASHLEPEAAAVHLNRAAPRFARHLATEQEWEVTRPLAEALNAVLCGAKPQEQMRPTAVAALGSLASPPGAVGTGAWLPPVTLPQPCPFTDQQLVELLKHPFFVGEARRIVLDQLANRYRRPFADVWAFVRFAEERQLGLDFTTPPKRLKTPDVNGNESNQREPVLIGIDADAEP
jgi:tRNA A-37 threonylcarbamoyl transferase component Bud32